ncbi:hypothetical protein RRG08_004351 [Elysia crispata]|uniref:Uncharacterized protein n=1 Tax=Elysia crispata TaxID=231223 RepID=A0AAE1B0D2_9GAST|nr:hypothetical protein RRG08_004351 [Elysia crispata]
MSSPNATPGTTYTIYTKIKLSSHVLNISDDFVLVLSILCVASATVYAARKVSQEFRAFYLADRSFHFLPVAASIFMSSLGSSNFVGAAGAASRSGISIYAYELNGVFALLALGWIFLPVYIASGSITTVEYVRKRYGGVRMEVYLSAVSIGLIIVSKIAVELYSLNRLLEIVYGIIPSFVACLILLIVASLITCSGGLKTVVVSNSVQGILLVLGATCIGRYSFTTFDDYDALRERYFDAWPNTTRIHFGNLSVRYKYTNCGIPKARSWNIFRPHYNLELPWPGMIFGITINSLWYFCCDQAVVQSGLGARDIVQAKYACILCAYGKILTIIFLILPGIVARILYTDLVACADPTVCQRICGSTHGCSDMAFPLLFLDVVPQGYRGVVLAALLACGVSSLSASLNSGSTIFTLNVYRNFRPIMMETELLVVTRTSVIVIGCLSLMVVPFVKATPLLHDYIQNITSSFAPPILAVFLCGLLWERASEQSAFRALLLGLLLAVIRLVWGLPFSREQCGDKPNRPSPQIIANFHFLHFSIFVFVLCTAYIAVAGVFSEPISEVHMYRLLYWLRHSKLDRVDLDELDEETYRAATRSRAGLGRFGVSAQSRVYNKRVSRFSTTSRGCITRRERAQRRGGGAERRGNCTVTGRGGRRLALETEVHAGRRAHNQVTMPDSRRLPSVRLVTRNVLRETVKQRADIHESSGRGASLNMCTLCCSCWSLLCCGDF